MIVEIERPRASCFPSISYNERKLTAGNAVLVGYANMDDPSEKTVRQTFEQYEKARYPVRQVSFHASVNPGPEDTTTQAQVVELVRGIMQEAGLAQQPYLLYRHDDIDRPHYHIVSVRIGPDRRKINCFQEKRRVSEHLQRMAREYGYTVPRKGAHQADDICREGAEERRARIPRLRVKGELRSQTREIVRGALCYDFTSAAQFACVLRHYGVLAGMGKAGFTFRGADASGKAVTDSVDEKALGLRVQELAGIAATRNGMAHHLHTRQRERVESLSESALEYSRSEEHFRRILSNRGITVHETDPEMGGGKSVLVFVDHSTRSVFEARELLRGRLVREMGSARLTGRWKEDMDRSGRVRTSRREAPEEATALRDIRARSAARIRGPEKGIRR